MLQKKDREKIIFYRESVFKVAKLIFDYPNKTFHIRKLSKETDLSTTAVIDSVKKLSEYNIITVEKTEITTNIKANLDSEAYTFYKKTFNLYRLERYDFVKNLKDYFNPETIVLFGSFARGEDVEESDIDILVISPEKVQQDLSKILNALEEELNRKINIHVLANLSKSKKEFKNAIANGVVLHGYLKLL